MGYEPPDDASHAPVLAHRDAADAFLTSLEEEGGNLSAACRALGISRTALYRHRERDPDFDGRVERALSTAVRDRARRLASMAASHLESHLREGWTVELDDDFEPRPPRSALPVRSAVEIHREARATIDGPAPAVSVQANQINNYAPRPVQGPPLDVEAILAECAPGGTATEDDQLVIEADGAATEAAAVDADAVTGALGDPAAEREPVDVTEKITEEIENHE